MVDRRQLSTRYAIQIEVAINIENKLIVKHVIIIILFLRIFLYFLQKKRISKFISIFYCQFAIFFFTYIYDKQSLIHV